MTQLGREIDDDASTASFDPRTWAQSPDEENQCVGGSRRAVRAGDAAKTRPPFFVAGAAGLAIFACGAFGAFMSRSESPNEIATATDASADNSNAELNGAESGISSEP